MKEFAKKILKSLPIAFTKNQQYDRDTQRVLRAVCHPKANCVDVGCHKGEVLELMLKYAPQGQHYGFEPIPDLYDRLITHFAAYDNCHFYQLGLSNVTGETSFNYVLTNPAYSGFVKRKYDKADEVDTLITVQKKPLDQILPPSARIDLIKIDVEGAELEVLQGAVQTIRQDRPVIIFEHGLGASDCYGTRPEQVYELLAGQGNLQVSTMARWLAGEPGFSAAEFVEQFEKSLNYYFMAYPAEKIKEKLAPAV
jgi:FkbM family methyltransferase